ncbi:DUF7738 domain-containing protein [Tenacibaculum sp. nBUS_03]|uniref:DUF7738 domain-containing protein n=1 Tax=Tenacibaculum sp. nBUS_03 TaxID=3395320 RepID=UPI003EB779AB
MKRTLLTLTLLLVISFSNAQKIEVDSANILTFNGKKVTLDLTPDELKKVFGKPDRITLKHNTMWTYDKLGFMVYIKPKSFKINNITINFKKESFDFSPKEVFKGELIIYNSNVTEFTNFNELKSIKTNAKKRNIGNVYGIKSLKHSIWFFKSEKNKSELSGCEINLI